MWNKGGDRWHVPSKEYSWPGLNTSAVLCLTVTLFCSTKHCPSYGNHPLAQRRSHARSWRGIILQGCHQRLAVDCHWSCWLHHARCCHYGPLLFLPQPTKVHIAACEDFLSLLPCSVTILFAIQRIKAPCVYIDASVPCKVVARIFYQPVKTVHWGLRNIVSLCRMISLNVKRRTAPTGFYWF